MNMFSKIGKMIEISRAGKNITISQSTKGQMVIPNTYRKDKAFKDVKGYLLLYNLIAKMEFSYNIANMSQILNGIPNVCPSGRGCQFIHISVNIGRKQNIVQ